MWHSFKSHFRGNLSLAEHSTLSITQAVLNNLGLIFLRPWFNKSQNDTAVGWSPCWCWCLYCWASAGVIRHGAPLNHTRGVGWEVGGERRASEKKYSDQIPLSILVTPGATLATYIWCVGKYFLTETSTNLSPRTKLSSVARTPLHIPLILVSEEAAPLHKNTRWGEKSIFEESQSAF